jgi:hypothetical protein
MKGFDDIKMHGTTIKKKHRILFTFQYIPSGVFHIFLEVSFLYNARGLSVCMSNKLMTATPDGSCHCEAVKNYLCSDRHCSVCDNIVHI